MGTSGLSLSPMVIQKRTRLPARVTRPPIPSRDSLTPASALEQAGVLGDFLVEVVVLLQPLGVLLPPEVARLGALLLHGIGESRFLGRGKAGRLELRLHVGR